MIYINKFSWELAHAKRKQQNQLRERLARRKWRNLYWEMTEYLISNVCIRDIHGRAKSMSVFFFVFFLKSSPIHGFYTQEPWFKLFESFTLVVFPQLMSISAAKYFQGLFTGKTFRSAGGHDCIKTQDNRWINNDRKKKKKSNGIRDFDRCNEGSKKFCQRLI